MLSSLLSEGVSQAGTTVFFNCAQAATNMASGATSETIGSEGYWFTCSMDKWWYPTISLGPGTPTGRYTRISLPAGIEAQAITAGPSGLITSGGGARITIRRADGMPFDLKGFSARLLANTAGAGGAIEVMPTVGGEDALPDPLAFDASGFAGRTFVYDTPTLIGYESYTLKLYVDFALTALTLVDRSEPGPPRLLISRGTSHRVNISWPAVISGFHLEPCSDLFEGFQRVDVSPTIQNGCLTVDLPATNRRAFFRLTQ